jgi:DNA-binding NtrC family response regulator
MATKKALVIDNEERILDICSDLLCKEGFCVETAKSGMSAFKQFHQQSFDLVITSLSMKAGTGFTVLGMIRALSPRTPVIIFTENGYSIAYHFLPLLGTCAFISKPCSDAILASCIKNPSINGNNGNARTLKAL